MRTKIDNIPLEESDSFIEKVNTSGKELRKPSKIWLPIYFSGFLISGILAFLCHYTMIAPKITLSGQNKPSALGARVLLCVLLGLSIWFIVHLVLLYFAIILGRANEKKGFLQITLIKNGWLMSLVASLLVLSFAMNIYDEMIEIGIKSQVDKAAGDEDNTTTMATFLMENLVKILLATSTFLGIFLIKAVLLDGLNFKMLFKNYEARIQRNHEDFKILELLNRITGKKMHNDVDKWAVFVFKTISPSNDTVELRTLEYFFGTEDARRILDRFDVCANDKLTQENFVLVYQEIINEDKRINTGMTQKVSIVKKLDLILSSILIPIGLFVTAAIPNFKGGDATDSTGLMGSVPFQLSTFLSFSFIFGPIVADIAKSLVFVFLVEVFDIGDKVFLDGSLHEISDIGLMYTSLISNKRVSVIQNIRLMDKQIVNLREAKVFKTSFEFTFSDSSEFKKKIESLKKEISKELEANQRAYTGKFEICDYKLKGSGAIGVRIDVMFRLQNQNMKALRSREDAFVIAIHDIFKNLELELS